MWDAIGYVAFAAIAVIVAIVAVRVKFDLNDYLRDRRERKARRKCPHYGVKVMEGGMCLIAICGSRVLLELWIFSATAVV